MVKPRHAVAYHFFNEEGTRYGIYQAIRETYEGPLSHGHGLDGLEYNRGRDHRKDGGRNARGVVGAGHRRAAAAGQGPSGCHDG